MISFESEKIVSNCYRAMPIAIWQIFSKFLIFCNLFQASEIIAKYEKRGKYLLVLQEAMCDNYFIIKCFLKLNVARVILLTNCIEFE